MARSRSSSGNPFHLSLTPPRVDVVPAAGGLNLTAPPVLIPQGAIIAGVNFVAKQNGGYERIGGYERFDGSKQPHKATYFSVIVDREFTDSASTIVVGQSEFIVLGVSGREVFLNGQPTADVQEQATFSVGGNTYTIHEVIIVGAQDLRVHATYRYAVAELVRQNVLAPPGVSGIIGVIESRDGVVAFRKNSSNNIAAFKSSASGWVPVAYAAQLSFTGGTGEVLVGNTITGASSGATAIVDEVIVVTGEFGASIPATGVLVLSAINGTFSSGEDILVGGVKKVTASSSVFYPSVPENASFNWIAYNFYGSADKTATYFVDGVTNNLYVFDGEKIAAISLGVGVGLSHITANKSRLYIAAGASLFISSSISPFKFDAVDGAAEIAVGSNVTNLVVAKGAQSSALVVTTDKSIHVLYGDDASSWQLQVLSKDVGAIKNTACLVNGDVLFASNSGVFSVQAVNQYGNFALNSMTQSVLPLYKELLPLFKRAVVRADESQYRLYCSDGRVLVATQARSQTDDSRYMAFSLVSYKDYETDQFVLNDVCRIVSSGGTERFFVASDNYVYEMDVGTSFDGRPIFAYFVTAFMNNKFLSIRKRYKRITISVMSDGYSECGVMYDVSPSGYDGGVGRGSVLQVYPLGTWYDVSKYGKFVWSAGITPEYTIDTPGTGKAISIMVKSLSEISDKFAVMSFTIVYSTGRMER